jgi:hypothetical protein
VTAWLLANAPAVAGSVPLARIDMLTY